jgi:hypothetical protein
MPDIVGVYGVAMAVTALLVILLGIAYLIQRRSKEKKDRYHILCHKDAKLAKKWPSGSSPSQYEAGLKGQAFGASFGTIRGFQMPPPVASRYHRANGEIDPYPLTSKISMNSLRQARFHTHRQSQPGDVLFAPRHCGVREPDNWV